MIRKSGLKYILPLILAVIVVSCVKETYDMDKLSGLIEYDSYVVFSGVRGSVDLVDVVEEDDTLFFDDSDLLKLVFREDSVFELALEDFVDITSLGDFSESYSIGELEIEDTEVEVRATLGDITDHMGMGATFLALDGTTSPFPPIPGGEAGSYSFDAFPNITEVELESGTLTVTTTNELPVDITGLRLRLINEVDGTAVFPPQDFPTVAANGGVQTVNIDLSGVTVKNPVQAVLDIFGSPGSATPVPIDLDDALVINASLTDVMVASGTASLPEQSVIHQSVSDTLDLDTGEGFELTEVLFNTGYIDYSITSTLSAPIEIELSLPTASQGGSSPVVFTLLVPGDQATNGQFDLSNVLVDLTSDTENPFNRLPVDISAIVDTEGNQVYFENTDAIQVDFSVADFDLGHVKGYFTNKTENLDSDSFELDIEEISSRISGDFDLTNPIVRLEYEHSFGIPLEIDLDITATDADGLSQSLNADPIVLDYSSDLNDPVTESVFVLDRDNSDLPELVSMLPTEISYSGSAEINPDGNQGYTNFILGDSKFLANLEIEVPFEFRMDNFALTDTLENPAKTEEGDEGISLEEFESFELAITADNGFPFGVGITVELYDSVNKVVLNTVDLTDFLIPAPIDGNGRSSGTSVSTVNVEIDQDFFDDLSVADELILVFEMNTAAQAGGTEPSEVKIYADYSIAFDLVVKVNAKLRTDFNE